MKPPQYDVAILGSGLAGSIAAACLARAGVSVLVVDAGRHPRFAVGESTIPYTSIMTQLISERYKVPEISYLSSFESIRTHISTNCGIKRNFGFVYHKPGQPHDPLHTTQFPINPITHAETHLFRADVDHWMIKVAQQYGAVLWEDTRVNAVHIDDSAGVELQLADGTSVVSKFIVDASGFRSPLAQQLGLREEPTRLLTHSRTIFTHMTGVRPFEETVDVVHGNPSPWSKGTLHHVFPGGWMWVIPFDNHKNSTSDLCSVGISYDPRVHPKKDDPAVEFDKFLADYPDVRKQFTDAQAVRPWVSTGRLQYSSSRTVGARWCLTAHAAGFIDALFSRGLQNTMAIIHSLVWRLLDALREDDFSVARFEYINELEQGLLDANDVLVANAYTSFQDWDLWNAWFRVWEFNQIMSTHEANLAYTNFVESRDVAALERLARLEPQGAIMDYAPARELLTTASQLVRGVEQGQHSATDAAEEIFRLLRNASFIPPLLGLADRANRWYAPSPTKVMRTMVWARRQAPPETKELFGQGLTRLLAEQLAQKISVPLAGRSSRD